MDGMRAECVGRAVFWVGMLGGGMRGSLGMRGGEGIATRLVRVWGLGSVGFYHLCVFSVKEMGCDVGVGDLGDGGLLVDRDKEVVVVSFMRRIYHMYKYGLWDVNKWLGRLTPGIARMNRGPNRHLFSYPSVRKLPCLCGCGIDLE